MRFKQTSRGCFRGTRGSGCFCMGVDIAVQGRTSPRQLRYPSASLTMSPCRRRSHWLGCSISFCQPWSAATWAVLKDRRVAVPATLDHTPVLFAISAASVVSVSSGKWQKHARHRSKDPQRHSCIRERCPGALVRQFPIGITAKRQCNKTMPQENPNIEQQSMNCHSENSRS